MRKGSTDERSPADLIDNAGQARKKVTGPDDNAYASREINKSANKRAQVASTTPPRRLRKKWLSEIAKTAASARWTRGD